LTAPFRPRPGAAPERPVSTGEVLVAFRVPSFRFQFSADLLTAWAIEMEVLILGWYVLTATDSPFLLALLGSLRFGGTLLSPLIGSVADRLPRKHLLIGIRALFAMVATLIVALALTGALEPWHAFAAAALTGLFRPADMMLRQSLIADAVPREALGNAMGFARAIIDSARIVGALAGAGLMAALGVGLAYTVVATFYAASTLLTLGIVGVARDRPRRPTRPVADLLEGVGYLRRSPPIVALIGLAFVVNFTALSLTGGLLPVVARDVYDFDETGLGTMVAIFAGGALVGSLLIAAFMRARRPEPVMVASVMVWHALIVVFALAEAPAIGLPVLALLGFTSSFTMVPMSTALLLAIDPEFRGRVMGVRQLAVFGLPLGLLLAGALIERLGVAFTFALFGAGGVLAGLFLAVAWRRLTRSQ
jgi:predicted MFS family arabinose efflux permease